MINDPNDEKLYLVMEYMKKQSILSKTYINIENKIKENINSTTIEETKFSPNGISIEKTLKYFRDFLLGLDYRKIIIYFFLFFFFFF